MTGAVSIMIRMSSASIPEQPTSWNCVLSLYLDEIWELEDLPERMQEALDADGRAVAGSLTRCHVREAGHGGTVIRIPLQLEASDEAHAQSTAHEVALDALRIGRERSRWSTRPFGWTMGLEVTSAEGDR
jgi:hypothetical protein